jgi:lipoprotein-anchoring transpeptidase ErfK/SrfK
MSMEMVADVPAYQPAKQPVPPSSNAPQPAAAANGSGARWIDVDLTNQMVYAYAGDTLVNSFVVSTGTWLTPTVTGQYKIYVKYRSAPMSGPGYYLPDVPYIMYFYKGYGLHGTYWHNNFGTPMSHGCVNLRTDEAAWLYNFASVGTLVNVHY